MITIRLAQETDLGSIQKVIETAFSDEENKVISNFAADLLKETTSQFCKLVCFKRLCLDTYRF